ncbi:hypothetical protein EJ04DRAFT_581653 [Polyplosphaeria fusca]|uniref:Zn(2)-C6 fungal-type domain-containing protein n=1 Tax=Polyplosphaeria fusca TaxID=682080 RepID=A0A9P4QIK7_9PLEO|nr:hypothetical protein EJ04DRAFT_581653 [Polyplosphaeria fusca]
MGKAKVKTGCRTCKIRKVKCDETKPVCNRCLHTGRICDGYGIWGGGGNFYGQQRSSQDANKSQTTTDAVPRGLKLLPGANVKERYYFEWFKVRALKKIPGPFALPFWNNLVVQASLSEPAILHAVLSLSSVHKNNGFIHVDAGACVDNEEHFMLQEYTKTIRELRPHLEKRARSSIHVALMACVLFVSLEFLRGKYTTAHMHLQNGLKVLETSFLVDGNDAAMDWMDDWVVATFPRLCVHSELFQQTYRHKMMYMPNLKESKAGGVFRSNSEAWQYLQQLLWRALHLSQRYELRPGGSIPAEALREQHELGQATERWTKIFETSRSSLENNSYGERICHLLQVYQPMLAVMVATCLRTNETVFDSHAPQFITVVQHSIEMWRTGEGSAQSAGIVDMSRSMVDMGWIQPLYYTALKCRIPRVRLHAIRLLESSSHREGTCDSRAAARVARWVMALESDGVDAQQSLHFGLDEAPTRDDAKASWPPESERLQEVQVVLCNLPAENIVLRYRRTGTQWEEVQVSL